MTSKNLYLAKWLENLKRRSWTFLLCFVAFLLLLPVRTSLALANMNNMIREAVAAGTTEEMLSYYQQRLQEIFAYQTGFHEGMVAVVALFAVLFAVQGFSFLYSRRKMDLYMSVPVSGPKRCVLLWANGVLVFGACYLFNLLLSLIVGASFGAVDCVVFTNTMLAWLLNMLGFVAIYNLALVAVMLTGNVLTALLGCVVLFFYEPVLRLLADTLKSVFFVTYCAADSSRFMNRPYLTPVVNLFLFSGNVGYEGRRIIVSESAANASTTFGQVCTEAGLLAAAALVCGLLAYLLFRKRKTESYGTAMAFGKLKGLIRFLLLIPFGVIIGMTAGQISGKDDVFLWLGTLLAVLIGHGIIQLIYERDLRAILKKRVQLLVCAVLALAVLAVFRFDLIGFDSFMPDQDDIEAVAVTVERDYSGIGGCYRLPLSEGNSGTVSDVLLSQMNSDDPDTIAAVLHMVQVYQEKRDVEGEDYGSVRPEGSDMTCWVVRYRLKSGRQVYRRFYADGALVGADIDAVQRDENYRKLRCQLYDDAFAQYLGQMKIVYSNGVSEYLYTMDKEEMLAALQEDMKQYDYSLVSSSLPVGMLTFSLPDSAMNKGYLCRWTYPVYDCFGLTEELLAKNSIPVQQEDRLRPEDVQNIQVSFYHYEETVTGYTQLFAPGEVEEQSLTVNFQKEEEIEQLLSALYPRNLMDAADRSITSIYNTNLLATEFSVSVTLSESGNQKHIETPYMFFIRAQMPDFVIQKLKEAAVRG